MSDGIKSLNEAYITDKKTIGDSVGRLMFAGNETNFLTMVKAWLKLQEIEQGVSDEEIKFVKKLLRFLSDEGN